MHHPVKIHRATDGDDFDLRHEERVDSSLTMVLVGMDRNAG